MRLPRGALRILGLVVLVVGASLVLWNAFTIFLLAFIGVLVGVALDAPARFLVERTPLGRGWALALTMISIVAVLVGAGWLVGPSIGQQVSNLMDTLPQSLEDVREVVRSLPGGAMLLSQMPGEGGGSVSGLNIVARVTGTVSTVWDVVAKLVFVLFLGIFLAATPSTYRDGLVRLFPPGRRDRTRDVFNELAHTLRAFLVGKAISMASIGVMVYVGLTIIGVPMALVLGIAAGLLEFIPIIGPFTAFVPAALIALSQGTTQALWVVVLYVAVQQVEGNVIVPFVQRRAVDLPPALTLVAVFVSAALFGVLGMLVATPFAAVGMVLVKMLYLHDALGEDVELSDGSSS